MAGLCRVLSRVARARLIGYAVLSVMAVGSLLVAPSSRGFATLFPLGLAVARSLARAMGADITFVTETGWTHFSAIVPSVPLEVGAAS